jgi:hypothetical protein
MKKHPIGISSGIRVLVFLLACSSQAGWAQDNTLFFMPGIPQSNQLNPALMYRCKTYVELPVISSFMLNIRNTGFGFHDALHEGTGTQSGRYFLDLNNLENKLWRMNYARMDMNIDLLGFGFALNDWYFTFGIANHTELRVSYPRDLVAMRDGNWLVSEGEANPIKLSGTKVNLTNWNSIGISAAKELYEGLQVGVRAKYLQGVANLNTRRSRMELNTTSNPISLEADMKYKLNASFPVVLGYDANGMVNTMNFDNAGSDIIGNYIFNKNRGLAFDAGMIYDLDDQTQLSASVTDLGLIWWRKNVNNFSTSGAYTFRGVDLDQYQANPGQTDFLQALQDTLMQSFHAAGSTRGYVTFTSVKLFGGVTRELLPKLKAGAMTKTEIYDLRIRPSLSLSLNYTPFKSVAASLSYTIGNNKLNQVGAGLALGNRGAQFYILTDNIPVRFTKYSGSFLMWPYNARMLSLRFGLNLMFGCKDNEKTIGRAGGGTPGKAAGNKRGPKRYKSSKICPAYW